MRYIVRDILRSHYNLSEHQIAMAMVGKANSLSEAYREGIPPEDVAEAIYKEYKQEAGL